MSEHNPPRIGPHDLGGLPGGPIDREEHNITFWERRIDAMVVLLFRKNVLEDTAELRRGIEALGPDVYDRLGYYERWAESAAAGVIARGIVTQEELDRRIDALRADPETAR